MKNKKNKKIIESLQSHLLTVSKLWDEKQQSEAYIVGYLEAVVKQTIEELKDQAYKVENNIFSENKKQHENNKTHKHQR